MSENKGRPEEDPVEAFKKGMHLLWKAARGTADEIKKEVDKGGVKDTLRDAGKELENAATAAAKALDAFVSQMQPKGPKYEKSWPPKDDGGAGKGDDGGKDPKSGERRDMRIQLDADKK